MLILKLLFFLAPGFMKNKILYFDSSEGASPGNTRSKSFSFLLNYVNSAWAALNNEDTKNINKKLKIPTQTYEAKLKSVFPNFLKLFTFCLLV